MNNILEKYGYEPNADEINASVETIVSNISGAISPKMLRDCLGMMDLTSLKNTDTPSDIKKLTGKVNDFHTRYPDYPNPASICVFPNFANVVRQQKKCDDVRITVVSGVFPHSQSFIEVKTLEASMAVENGADEVDIVIALNAFLDGDYDTVASEIRAVRSAIDEVAARQGRKAILKVILETGLLVEPKAIAEASFIAMESGADFIKTSTGKVEVSATPVAAYVMCQAISAFYKVTGRKVGFKPAGGMTTSKDAACYYCIVSSVLGNEWLNKNLFRLGVSRMANNLLSDLEQMTVSFF